MVLTEAMSKALPVIATDNSVGPELINHGEDGWVISAGDEEALENIMSECVQHKYDLIAMGLRAREKAMRWQWSDYRRSIAQNVLNKMEEKTGHID